MFSQSSRGWKTACRSSARLCAVHVRVLDSVGAVDGAAWNELAGADNPFVRHEFLTAMETSGCVGPDTGWTPCPLAVSRVAGGPPLGVVPLYLKTHSWGEYVFDWSWARAYERAGGRYYPKLVAAVPFTPVSGPRVLAANPDAAAALVRGAIDYARELGVSSLHWLFTDEHTTAGLEGHGLLRRTGNQFHWSNDGYVSFDDFLAQLAADKRKKIRRERRRIHESGLHMRVRTGHELQTGDWARFTGFYTGTVSQHGGMPYLNQAFFERLGATMAGEIVMVEACAGDEVEAAALFLRGSDTLYGRYWGCRRFLEGLHFETCYYRAMEYAIDQGLRRFEAGAQGEHKLARGLLPVTTYSAHWLGDPALARAVADFLRHERGGVRLYQDELAAHAPFRRAS